MSEKNIFVLLRTLSDLGFRSVLKVFIYRLLLKFELGRSQRLRAGPVVGPFFKKYIDQPVHSASREQISLLEIPDWHVNTVTGKRAENYLEDWWRISDFDSGIGDIKKVWDLSRFDWVLKFAKQALSGEDAHVEKLNEWLADWCINNPPYKGVNWKCGQEAAIRVMHLAMAALILKQARNPEPSIIELVKIHLERIKPTLSYAMAQDNNHGTSEAAALYIGGSWLMLQGKVGGEGLFCLGLKWLENRAGRLIANDGSFSQYSVNYHRVLLDTFCMVEIWRRYCSLPKLSEAWYSRALAASEWLRSMVNPLNGDAPNLGANDGARFLPLTSSDYRDFRPSVQLSMALFAGVRAYDKDGEWNLPLRILDVEIPEKPAAPLLSCMFDDGGFAILRKNLATAVVRYPRFRFRPSQADALHLDLWLGARNLLRDAGTYSYNTDAHWLTYFPGTASHNTVQFDDRDQMPRLSRFLFGDWLKTSYLKPLSDVDGVASFSVAYQDRYKARHQRAVHMFDNKLRVIDTVEGFFGKAVLRWRLESGHWRVEGNGVCNGEHLLTLESSMPIVRFELTEGWESRYYLEKEKIPVLEIEVHQPGTLTTEYRWFL